MLAAAAALLTTITALVRLALVVLVVAVLEGLRLMQQALLVLPILAEAVEHLVFHLVLAQAAQAVQAS
jgi:hypothetical protein